MKVHFTKVSLALLSAALVLGCQDVGTGPDGLVPQFAQKEGKGKGKPPSGDVSATVTLAIGMGMAGLPLVGKYDDNTVSLNTNDFDVKIDMKFSPNQACTMIVGEDDGSGVIDHLRFQLANAGPTSGAFFLEVDKTGLTLNGSTQSEKHLLLVEYADDFDGHLVQVLIIHGDQFSPAKVEWEASTSSQDVFHFTGKIVVWMNGVGGLKGKRGRRAMACGVDGDNLVKVTVDRS